MFLLRPFQNGETGNVRKTFHLVQRISIMLSQSRKKALIVSIRRSTWFPIDEVHEMLLEQNPSITRSSVYRCLCNNNINKVPTEEKEKVCKFKEYEPGYLHIDVTYFPKLNGQKWYLFVAIDRATRAMFYQLYENKTAKSAQDFFNKCIEFFPFEITHILTDNGLEFTNRLIKSKKGENCKKKLSVRSKMQREQCRTPFD